METDKLNLGNDPIMIARTKVVNEFNTEDNTFYQRKGGGPKPVVSIQDTRIVLFAYILGGWKATVITTLPDRHYYEVTYNAAKDEVYCDTYVKKRNVAYTANGGRKVEEYE